METGFVTTKGQLVIPSKLRRKYSIKTGTRIIFFEEEEGIKIIPITAEIIDVNKGFLKTKGKLLSALANENKGEGI